MGLNMKYGDKKKEAKTNTAGHATPMKHSLFSHGAAQSKASSMKSGGGCKSCGKRKG
jgi:hypothetical protein